MAARPPWAEVSRLSVPPAASAHGAGCVVHRVGLNACALRRPRFPEPRRLERDDKDCEMLLRRVHRYPGRELEQRAQGSGRSSVSTSSASMTKHWPASTVFSKPRSSPLEALRPLRFTATIGLIPKQAREVEASARSSSTAEARHSRPIGLIRLRASATRRCLSSGSASREALCAITLRRWQSRSKAC